VEWEAGERAYLVIGIAANADEHVGVLANLAEVIEDEDAAAQLAHTTDAALIVERLSHAREAEA
jgi:phosphocarrier protein FPr